jgi:hypothetical protein
MEPEVRCYEPIAQRCKVAVKGVGLREFKMLDEPTSSSTEPVVKTVENLADALILAKPDSERPNSGPGGAVFLIGAGCSVSAGIEPASGVAKYCAKKLAQKLSGGVVKEDNPEVALTWLIENKKVVLRPPVSRKDDGSHWGPLYSYFFEAHFQSANMQRELINEIIDLGGDKLNWAHACLGELVHLRYAHTVLTTNFDQLVLQGIIRTGDMPVTADGLEALNRITGRPKRPQVVHLHGSMHTYDLRNSPTALNETSRSSTAQAMVHTLMKDCDLLVVVGYGGGEEGIMALLQDAGRVMPSLVIYWVTHKQGFEGLTENARRLLSGENKFAVWGGTADKFFGDLMAAMKIGQPRWVSDPIAVLKEQSDRLLAPTDDLEAAKILVQALRDRVEHANTHRWDEQREVMVRAAEKRARGEYQASRDLLENVNRDAELTAARMHALNGISIFEQDPIANGEMLKSAIEEFTKIIGKTEGSARLGNILSLCVALIDESEAAADNSTEPARVPLRQVADLARKWLPIYTEKVDPLGNAQLNLRLAQALQGISEKPYDAAGLLESQQAYQKAIHGFAMTKDPGGQLMEAKSGLAAAYQVQGEEDKNADLLRKAVALHREVVELSRGADRTIEEAGSLQNLAGSLGALAKQIEPGEAAPINHEARSALERAIAIHQRLGDEENEKAVRRDLDEIASSAQPVIGEV